MVAERAEIGIYALKEMLPELLIKYLPAYELGRIIMFGSSGNATDYFQDGWDTPEEDFIWIVQMEGASLEIPIPSLKGETLTLSAKMFSFIVPGKLDKQTVEILINSQKTGKWELTVGGRNGQIYYYLGHIQRC